MKFFIDTANISEIKDAYALGLVDGVTTNPTLMSKERGKGSYKKILKEICNIVKGPVSAEVISFEHDEMIKEAKELHEIAKNINIKVPISKEGLKVTKTLREIGIQTNMTLIFSASQAILAAKAGATFISPFVGRLDDVSHFGMELIADILTIYRNYNFDTQVIVASIRNPLHVVEAAKLGAHIATIPFKIMESLCRHPLTDNGIQKFLDDWKKVQKDEVI